MQLLQKADIRHGRMGYSVTEAADVLGNGTIRAVEVDRPRQDPLGEDWQSPHYQRRLSFSAC